MAPNSRFPAWCCDRIFFIFFDCSNFGNNFVNFIIMEKVDEIKSSNKKQRVSAHSHVKGLGLNEEGNAIIDSFGLIGQTEARKV